MNEEKWGKGYTVEWTPIMKKDLVEILIKTDELNLPKGTYQKDPIQVSGQTSYSFVVDDEEGTK